jgi:hypothetical protein
VTTPLKPSTRCFVCTHVRDGARPVKLVMRTHAGERIHWQFMCGDEHPAGKDSWAVVTIGELLERDGGLAEVLDLPFNSEAERAEVGATWVRRDLFLTTMLTAIEQQGFYVVGVLAEGDLPAFAFTVGLWKTKQHPELFMVGGTLERMSTTVGMFAKAVVEGSAPVRDGLVLRELARPLAFMKMARRHYAEWLGAARMYHGGDDFDVLQVFMADPSGRFPWEPAVDEMYVKLQPILGDGPRPT